MEKAKGEWVYACDAWFENFNVVVFDFYVLFYLRLVCVCDMYCGVLVFFKPYVDIKSLGIEEL